jgi:hypothetical protein
MVLLDKNLMMYDIKVRYIIKLVFRTRIEKSLTVDFDIFFAAATGDREHDANTD